MQSTRIWSSPLILTGLAALAGCGSDAARSGSVPDPAEGSASVSSEPDIDPPGDDYAGQSGTGPGRVAPTPASQRSTRSRRAGGASSRGPIDPGAHDLFSALVRAYQDAEQYSDRGFVELAYRRQGQDYRDRAPLSVRFRRQTALELRAYAVHLGIRRGSLLATIEDPLTENFDNQLLDVALDRGQFSLAEIYSDPAVSHFASAGLGGPSPQLELLLSDDPLGGLIEGDAALTLDAAQPIDNRLCDILSVETDGLRYRFWVDRDDRLLRRVELPAESAGLSGDPSVQRVRLKIELASASFTSEPHEHWTLPERPLARRVTRFVPPPPPLASPLLGRRPADFQLRPAGESFRVDATGSDRDFTVLLWIADHPASRLASRQLQSIADATDGALAGRTRFVLVMAEPVGDDPQHSVRLLRRWNVGLPVADDGQAVGRDVFGISAAPTLVVLGPSGTVEWFQPSVGPDMASRLPALLRDLSRGIEVGQMLRSQHRTDRETYREMLEEVRSRPADNLPRR